MSNDKKEQPNSERDDPVVPVRMPIWLRNAIDEQAEEIDSDRCKFIRACVAENLIHKIGPHKAKEMFNQLRGRD